MIKIEEVRSCSTDVLHKIWDSIETIANNTGGDGWPCPAEVLTHLETKHGLRRGKAESELLFAIADRLVVLERDEEGDMMTLKLPDSCVPREKSRYDWYCFHCHLGRKPLVGCSHCHRVYHPKCADTLSSTKTWLKERCPACIAVINSRRPDEISLVRLNALMKLIVEKVRDKNLTILNCRRGDIWAVASGRKINNTWRRDLIVWKPIDLEDIHTKALNDDYCTLETFNLDCETLLHNVAVYSGSEELLRDNMAAGAFEFLRNTLLHAYEEMKICFDCFEQSFDKRSSLSFSLPCAKPHKVIWVRTTSGLFWPGKVMQKVGDCFDVILFGESHPRVLVSEEDTADDMLSPPSSNPRLKEALQELDEFQNSSGNDFFKRSSDNSMEGSKSNANKRPKPLKNIRKKLPRKAPVLTQKIDSHSSTEEEQWEVEQVLATKLVGRSRYYWISWKGYPESQNSWEPARNLNCPDLIQGFLESQKQSDKRSKKSKVVTTETKSVKSNDINAMSESEEGSTATVSEWEVEQILDCKIEKETGIKYYLISWKGFSPEDNSWEKESNLNCNDLIEKFNSQLRKSVKKSLGDISYKKPNCQKRSAVTPVNYTQPKMSRGNISSPVVVLEKVSNKVVAPFRGTKSPVSDPGVQQLDHAELPLTGTAVAVVKGVRIVTKKNKPEVDINPCAHLIDKDLELPFSINDLPQPVERTIVEEEVQNDSDLEFEEKLKTLFGGPLYENRKACYICLGCSHLFDSDISVKIHIVNEHQSFFENP